MWEWFLHSSVLEQTESNLSKINWLRGVILLIPIMLVPWGRFPLCHTPIRPISTFWDQISILIVGCVTTWSRGLHHLVSELGSETRSYHYVIFVFFSFNKLIWLEIVTKWNINYFFLLRWRRLEEQKDGRKYWKT